MAEVKLPEGWELYSLDELAVFIDYRGKTPNKTEYGIPLITAKNIRDGYINRDPKEYISEDDYKPWMTRGIPRVGDVVITTEAPMGNVALIDINEKFALAQRAICLQFNSKDLAKCSHYFMRGQRFKKTLLINATGTTVSGIKASVLKKLELPVPPPEEQKIITERLDSLLAQVATIKARLDAIPALLKRFRQSVLSGAVSGKLTEEWRNKNNIYLLDWKTSKLADYVHAIEAGKSLKCIETPPVNSEYGIIKISAVTWGVYDENESKTLPEPEMFIEDRRVKVGDFLISRANTIELLGNPVIVKSVSKNLMLSDKVLRLQMADADKPWISIFLRSKRGRKEIESRSTGNQLSMRNIGQKALLDIDLPKPSLMEQTEIVRRVEQLFAYAESVEQQVAAAQSRVNQLTQAILAKAFSGELTADWRAAHPELISGEHSAAALLARIQAERAVNSKPARRTRRTATA